MINMSNNIKPVVVKDLQYWEDVIYVLKKMARLNYEPNMETEVRIKERCGDPNTFLLPDSLEEEITDFKVEMFVLIRRILKNATGTSSGNPFSIYKYPEEVKDVIAELETELAKLKEKNGPTLSLKND